MLDVNQRSPNQQIAIQSSFVSGVIEIAGDGGIFNPWAGTNHVHEFFESLGLHRHVLLTALPGPLFHMTLRCQNAAEAKWSR